MRITGILILILIACVSCESGSEKNSSTPEKSLSFNFKSVKLELLESTSFLNGDKIPQAQSASEWKAFCDSKKPAWCFADEKNKKGILYNYYVLMDQRLILPKNKEFNKRHVQDLFDEFQKNKVNLRSKIGNVSSVQRTFYGSNCDLKFFQTWIFKSQNMGQNKAMVMVLDLNNNEYRMDSVSVNNGFSILAIKK